MIKKKRSELWKIAASVDATVGVKQMVAFCRAMDQGEAPSQDILAFFDQAFYEILCGDRPNKALQLDQPTRRKKKTLYEIEPDVRLGFAVDQLRADGFNMKKALYEVAQKFGCSESKVKKAELQTRSMRTTLRKITMRLPQSEQTISPHKTKTPNKKRVRT